MNDAFAAKVYPSILYVLGLLDRINAGRGPEPTLAAEKPKLKQYLGQLDSRGADHAEAELAKSALTYWMDEMLVNSRWSQANEWKNNTLERELYDARDRAWEFFEKAKVARGQGRSDALETFYLCVALGFQGIYRDGEQQPAASASPPAVAKPAAPPKSAPPPKAPATEMTWFSEKGSEAPSGEEQTWGFGIPQEGVAKAAAPAPTPPPPPATPAPKRNETRQDLPRTLQEWAAPVYAQIVPGGMRGFIPTAAAESQRDARPLNGRVSFQRSLNLAIALGAVALVLAIWGMI